MIAQVIALALPQSGFVARACSGAPGWHGAGYVLQLKAIVPVDRRSHEASSVRLSGTLDLKPAQVKGMHAAGLEGV